MIDAIRAAGRKRDRVGEGPVSRDVRMVMDDRTEVVADVDHVHACMRPGPVPKPREVRAVRLLDREGDRRRSARGRRADRVCREQELARGLHCDRRWARGAPAAAREPDEPDERDSVQPMVALTPTPVGVGPEYHPRPAVHAACTAAPISGGARVHLELFANGRVVIVPAAIGLRGARQTLGRVNTARCRARVWTLDPTGVFHFTGHTVLGDVFGVWGKRLAPVRLLTFHGAVRVYVNGALRRGPPGTLVLHDRDEIVLEVGAYVPPHRSYRFPPH